MKASMPLCPQILTLSCEEQSKGNLQILQQSYPLTLHEFKQSRLSLTHIQDFRYKTKFTVQDTINPNLYPKF